MGSLGARWLADGARKTSVSDPPPGGLGAGLE